MWDIIKLFNRIGRDMWYTLVKELLKYIVTNSVENLTCQEEKEVLYVLRESVPEAERVIVAIERECDSTSQINRFLYLVSDKVFHFWLLTFRSNYY